MANGNENGEVDYDAIAETRVWQAVILQTVEEWINGPTRLSVQAERYLFSDNTDFPMVCLSAGMDVQRLRSSLARVKNRIAKSNRNEEQVVAEPLAAVA
jgi:hypothetical protein